ncbi:MAG TPA: hypothetical protein VN155_18990 [Devosia sp.]|nr:hypothetical protein [Devosia sp.]
MSDHYVVAEQDRAWHYSFKGALVGPYTSKELAIAAAIKQARASGSADIEVVVRDADMRSETVWRSD